MAKRRYKLVMKSSYRKVDHERLRNVSDQVNFVLADSEEQMLREAEDADIIMGIGAEAREVFGAAKRLKWIQIGGAGAEFVLFPELIESDVILTNARGIFSEPIADHVFAMLLALTRGMKKAFEDQRKHVWAHVEAQELAGKVMGIIGPGGIGTAVAKRALGFGMRVVAVRRRAELPFEYAEKVWGREGLGELLRVSDAVAICAPHTRETRGMIGHAELELMKPTAYLLNVGRGKIVDEEALIEFLKAQRIAGAGLDVFANRRPAPESEFWELENVVITPHMAGNSPEVFERRTELYCENVRRFAAGEELLNVVDKQAGY